jgi:hypothetical protein
LEEWLTQTDPELVGIHADMLRRSWKRLDNEQRAVLKAEGNRFASTETARDDLRALPD